MGFPIMQSEGSPSSTEEVTPEIHYNEIYECINTYGLGVQVITLHDTQDKSEEQKWFTK